MTSDNSIAPDALLGLPIPATGSTSPPDRNSSKNWLANSSLRHGLIPTSLTRLLWCWGLEKLPANEPAAACQVDAKPHAVRCPPSLVVDAAWQRLRLPAVVTTPSRQEKCQNTVFAVLARRDGRPLERSQRRHRGTAAPSVEGSGPDEDIVKRRHRRLVSPLCGRDRFGAGPARLAIRTSVADGLSEGHTAVHGTSSSRGLLRRRFRRQGVH